MILCCLDQSTKMTGYSIWRDKELVGHGVIDLSCITDKEVRTVEMYKSVKSLIKNIKPNFVIIEETQFQSNQKTFRTLAQLQGLFFAIFIDCEVGYLAVEPLMWKSHIGIKSKKREEQKQETMEYVSSKYPIEFYSDDESDSIAIGIWATKNLVNKGE